MVNELAGLPSNLGRYALVGLLGRGGMGRVVRGHDPKLKRDVALKLVEPLAVEPEDLDELRFMFHREARSTAQLRHPGIIEVYDYSGPDAELPYIACELLDAPTVADVIADRGAALTPRISAALGYELCAALAHAHGAGIVHRDLKTDNIFWSESGRVVLADFGIAKALERSAAKLGATVQFGQTNVYGSPAYMAPEQLTGGEVGPRSDLYALGCVLFECVTGAQAFRGADLHELVNHVMQGRRVLRPIPSTAPASLTRLIDELLEVDPERRPNSAVDVQHRLRDVLDALEVGDPRPWLADFGSLDDVDHDETKLDLTVEAETKLFSEASSTIRVHRARVSPQQSRAPFIFAMVTVAVGLGIGVTLISRLASFPDVGSLFSDGAMMQSDEQIFISLEFPGTAEVRVDGFSMGRFERQIRFAMTAGSHTITVESELGVIEKNIVLIEDTEPRFEFTAADFQSTEN